MRTKIRTWGNSLAIRIPKAFAEELGVRPDSEIDLELEDRALTLRPAHREYALDELLAGITDENLHTEVPTGPAVGRETW